MTGFVIDNFGGVVPRLGARLLPKNSAQTAQNTKLFSGELRSWQRPSLVFTPSKGGNLKSVYRMYTTSSDIWLAWPYDVDVTRSPIAGDAAFKIYYTGDITGTTGAKKTNLALTTASGTDYPHDYLELGVPAPGSAPSISSTGGTSTSNVTRVYCYTYVTNTASWSEEGPPSPLGTGTGKSDATFIVATLSTGTTGKYAFTGGIKRVYRTLTDNAGNTNYQLALDNVPMATTSTNDTVLDGALGVICPSFINGVVNSEWVAPPSDLTNIVALPNGIMAGFSVNQVCFSEPFFPHAWPIRYRLTTNFDIVSLGVYGQTLIVTTKGFPYAIVGSRPDSMAMTRIEESHPCVSKRSTVTFPFGVAWATPDGLALAGVGGTVNVIKDFMKRDEWRAQCFPDTLIARQFQDAYFGFFTNGAAAGNFVFDRANVTGPLSFGNFSVQGAWTDPETSKLYLVMNGAIYLWDGDANNASPYDWRSKIFVLPKPLNFGAIQVDANFGSIVQAAQLSTQSAADIAVNAGILGTGAIDTSHLTAWAATTSYALNDIRKSVSGVVMLQCIQAGTSSTTEAAYPNIVGRTATDGGVKWQQIWDLQGVTKGDIRAAAIQSHISTSAYDPIIDGTAGNVTGFPLRGSLLVGGAHPVYDTPNILLQVYAITTASADTTTLIASKNIVGREPVRLPRGYKSDTFEVRLSGNVAVRYFKIAETMAELGTL